MAEAAPAAVAAPEAAATPAEAPATPIAAHGDGIDAIIAKIEAQESGEAPAEAAAPAEAPAEAEKSRLELRREFLAAGKAKRKADESMKQAREMNDRATKFGQVSGQWKEDPVGLLRAAGIDEKQYFQALTHHALKDVGAPIDPIVDHGRRVEALEQQLAQERNARAQYETQAMRSQALGTVGSVFAGPGADAHEALLAYHDGDPRAASAYVLDAIESHWRESGEIIQPAEAARQLEEHHAKAFEAALARLEKTKKFAARFRAAQAAADTAAKQGARGVAKTLSNRSHPGAGAAQNGVRPTKPGDRDADVDDVLRKLGIA
jgi:hypothetical protein